MAPYLAVYISNHRHINPLQQAGASLFILEHYHHSPRSFITKQSEQSSLKDLATHIHSLGLSPWLNLEKIHHPRDIDELKTTHINTFKDLNIRHFRIHDLGLVPLFRKHYPEATLCYAAEFGNSHLASVHTLSKHVQAQQLSNDCPLESLKKIRQHCPTHPLWLQIHGPILIQYSKRRYIQQLEQAHPKQQGIIRLIQDEELPNRHFKIYDSPLGHCMFANFDRCLLKVLPQLLSCKLDTWLIDGRGESLDYTLAALKAYTKALQDIDPQQKTWTCPKDIWDPLQETSPRPLTAVYFSANNSDRERPSKHPIPENAQKIATVCNIEKGKFITLKLAKHCPTLHTGDTLLISTPSGKLITLSISFLNNTLQRPLSTSQSQRFINTHWQKGIEVNSKVFLSAL